MLAILALTPLVGINIPMLTPLIFSAAGALGYKVMVDLKEGGDLNEVLRQKILLDNTITLRLEDMVLDSMEEEVRRAEVLNFEKDGITLSFIKDERGRLRIDVTGPTGMDKKVLEKAGREFAEEVSQLFAQDRIVKQLEKLGADVVGEETEENGDIVLTLRRWH